MQDFHIEIKPMIEFNVRVMEQVIGKRIEEFADSQTVRFHNLDNEKNPHIHIIVRDDKDITERQIQDAIDSEREKYFEIVDVSKIKPWESR